MSRLIIIDSNALIHRAFHALPTLTDPQGRIVQGVYGFCLLLLRALNELKPDYIVAAFDLPGPTFRDELYKEYKAKRPKAPPELYQQMPLTKKVLDAFNIKVLEREGFEADDIIGSLSERFKKQKDLEILILTGDLDTLQLVDKNVKVYTLRKGLTDTVIYDVEKVRERFGGLKPWQLPDFKGLKGDPSDNIPGVKGIGEKTALALIKNFGSIENLYKALKQKEKIKDVSKRIVDYLEKDEAMALFSKTLATIKKDLKIKVRLDDLSVERFDLEKIKKIFYSLGFKSLIQRIPEPTSSEKEKSEIKINYHLVKSSKEFEKFVETLNKEREYFIEVDNNNLFFIFKNKKIIELSLPTKAQIQTTMKNRKNLISGYDLKEFFMWLKNKFGYEAQGKFFDLKLAAYILEPGKREYGIEDLVYQYLKPKSLKRVRINSRATPQLVGYSLYLFSLKTIFEKLIKKNGLSDLYYNIEIPLIEVLASMELNGMKINREVLGTVKKKVEKELGEKNGKIIELAGQDFNLNSPQQLSYILFEKLNLPKDKIRKTKEGHISTDAQELLKLKGLHPIIQLIFEYRELEKLYNTYLVPFETYVKGESSRVYPKFLQTVAATGRIITEKPNLQNIPQKGSFAQEFRKVFIAEKRYKLVAFDYSQIELRIAAHVACERNMIKAFILGKDIHRITAAGLFEKKEELVTEQERRVAKTINFAILYGLSAHGLAQTLQISHAEAQKFIDNYFSNYPALASYIEKIIKKTRKLGYVRSLFGRTRLIPEINSENLFIRNQGERMAQNFPIQATQADIIKKAMVEIYNFIKNNFKENEVRMILQIHDELIFEVKENLIKDFASKIKKIMEETYKLKVPLEVEVKIGDNWGERKTCNFARKIVY